MAKWFDEICYMAKFCGIPLLGVAAYELKDKAWSDRLICFGWFFFLNLGVLRFEAVLHGTEHAYTIVWLYVCAFLVILLAWMIDRAGNWRGEIVSICKKIDELLLPFFCCIFPLDIIRFTCFAKAISPYTFACLPLMWYRLLLPGWPQGLRDCWCA